MSNGPRNTRKDAKDEGGQVPWLRSSPTAVAVGRASECERNPRSASQATPPRSGGTNRPQSGFTATRLPAFRFGNRGFRSWGELHPRLPLSGLAGAAASRKPVECCRIFPNQFASFSFRVHLRVSRAKLFPPEP